MDVAEESRHGSGIMDGGRQASVSVASTGRPAYAGNQQANTRFQLDFHLLPANRQSRTPYQYCFTRSRWKTPDVSVRLFSLLPLPGRQMPAKRQPQKRITELRCFTCTTRACADSRELPVLRLSGRGTIRRKVRQIRHLQTVTARRKDVFRIWVILRKLTKAKLAADRTWPGR